MPKDGTEFQTANSREGWRPLYPPMNVFEFRKPSSRVRISMPPKKGLPLATHDRCVLNPTTSPGVRPCRDCGWASMCLQHGAPCEGNITVLKTCAPGPPRATKQGAKRQAERRGGGCSQGRVGIKLPISGLLGHTARSTNVERFLAALKSTLGQ